MDAKKQVELRYLNAVRCGIDDFPRGTVIETESPDFLIESPECTIGVEITRIFSPAEPNSPQPQSQDNERDLIAERAKAIAVDQSLPPVMVDIYFDSRKLLRKRDRDAIGKALVDIVAANMPAFGDDRSIENRHAADPRFPTQVAAMHIWRFKPLTSHLWQTGNGGIVNENFSPYLQWRINCKNGKVSMYRRKCDACWLVIVADWRGPSAFFTISEKMSGNAYTAAFDRVYFVERYSDRVVMLNTTADAG
ncbi:MAG: hypothetical protein RQ741_06935 [Wenzhouxiangellaceae bacterium]|nr:hypothetical protein [Wenzhouxiangellaceae bacterium]